MKGITTARELPAKLRCAPTTKLLAVLIADWSVFLPRNALIGSLRSLLIAARMISLLPSLACLLSLLGLLHTMFVFTPLLLFPAVRGSWSVILSYSQ